jgi:hypothetical protein
VTTISSPADSSRPSVRVSMKLSVVMFCPNTTSSGAHDSSSAAASRESASTASVCRLVAKKPPAFAFAWRR